MLVGTAVVIGITIPHTINGDISEALYLSNPLESLEINPTESKIKQAVVYITKQYGMESEQIINTIKCESNFNNLSVGDSGLAVGIAQFHKPTFNQFCEGNYYSASDQLLCMVKMFKNGLMKHWSCYKKLYKP